MAKRTFSRQTQASAASRSSASLASASSDLPPPPPSPGRLAKVLSRTPHALTPSHRSSSQSSSTMGAVMSSSSSSSASTAQVPPSPSTGGRFRRVFAARRKKTDDGQTQLVLHPLPPPPRPPPTPTSSQGPIAARSNQPTSSSHPPTTLAGEPSPTLGLAAPAPPPKSPRMMPPPSQHPPAITAPPRTSSVPAAILPTATAPAHEPPTVTTTTAPAPVPAPVPAPALVQAPASNAAPAPDPAISLSTVHERTPVIDGSTGASSQPKEPESAVDQVTDAEPHEGEGEDEHATAMMAAESHDGNHPTATTATTQAGTDHMPRDPEPERRARDPGPDHKAKEPEPDHKAREAEVDHKADWRKSDATMSSYYTVRPPSSGARTRPVSMADSLQSTSTVVANTTKRLSALLTEAEFVMAEADEDLAPSSSASASTSLHRRASSARKRHSISLHFTAATTPTAPSTSGSTPTPTPPPLSVTRAAAAGIISPTTRNGIPSSPASQIRGRLAAWAPSPESPNTPPFPPGPDKWMPQVPAQHMQQHDQQQQQQAQAHARQGMLGFGKRAVERMGRALGGLSSNNHAHAHTNSTSHTGSTSSSSSAGSGGVPDEWRRPRRTPNAPSGTWSISTTGTGAASASSASDVDGPGLGERMRPPMATRGLVFGQPLERCVRHTALEPVRVRIEAEAESGGQLDAGVRVPLEERLVPALVVRCAQHIMKWGLEEEGLFRISGRASHVAKLRAEFDTGADYDLRECPPGDLDPHAVASIFKAYLRELPEPILTKRLNPLFEAAMAHENETRQSLDNAAGANSGPNTPSPSNSPKLGGPGQRRSALPTSPRDARLLKPPSLSTLAMPNFAGMRPPSDRLLATFANLVARLPREHRDLLRTVTELIRATAARRETRMPLSNLTVVFCPSLAMSPPILRVLCESEEIWDGPRSPVSVGAQAEAAAGDANDAREGGDVATSVPAADDTASSVSSDAPREPWPPLSSPSSSSLATPNDDSASSVLAPQAADTDDEFGIRPADGAAAFKTSSTPPVAFPSSSISPGPSSRRLDSLSSSVSSLSSTSPSTSSPRRMLSISGPLHLPPRAATTPSTPVTGSPTILPAFAPIERQKRPSLTARFAKRSLNSLRASRAFSNSRSGSSSPVISAPFIVGREPESEPEPELETEAEIEVEAKPKQKPMGRPPMLEMPPEMSPLKVPDVLREDDGDLAREKRREKGVSRMRHASASSPNLTTPALPITASNEQEKQSGEKGEGEVESKPSSHTRGMTPLTNLPEPYNRLSLWEDSGDDVVDGEWASSVLLAADAGWLGNGTESER